MGYKSRRAKYCQTPLECVAPRCGPCPRCQLDSIKKANEVKRAFWADGHPGRGRPRHAYSKRLQAEGLLPTALNLYYELRAANHNSTLSECVALANRAKRWLL